MRDCPPLESLEELVQGRASDAELERHSKSCPRCSSALAQLEADRTLASELAAAVAPRASPPRPAAVPAIAGFEIVREIHRGGQGIVYEAQQQSPRRRVAIKVLLESALAKPERLRRFEREIDLVAGLAHPHIVSVHQCGTTDDGRHFYVMDYVEGAPLDQHARARREGGWSTRDALELFTKIAGAVSHAHQRGVLHRDLKPDNILVDPAGQPRVLDFGLAKAIDDGRSPAGDVTRAGWFLGTLAYASPEQVRCETDAIDVRSDVYALGMLLHEMLTGELPYVLPDSLSDAVDAILHAVPRPPKGCDDEIAAILEKALAKDRERRYASAAEFVQDVRRYLAGDPIEAKRGRTGYLLKKMVARHKAAACAAAIVALTLVAATVVSIAFAQRADRATRLATTKATTASRIARFLGDMLGNLNPERARGRNVTVRELLDEEAARLETEFRDEPEVQAVLAAMIGSAYRQLALFGEAEPQLVRSLELRRRRGVPAVERIESEIELARLRRDQSRFEAAEQLYGEARAELDRIGAEGEALRAPLLRSLALLRYAAGEHASAAPLFREAIERFDRRGEREAAAAALTELGDLLHERGDDAAAEPLLRDSLERMRALGRPEQFGVATALRNLARTLGSLHRLDEALPLQEEALRIATRIHGEKHVRVVLLLTELALLQAEHEGVVAAASSRRRALEMRPALVASSEIAWPKTLSNLGVLAKQEGRLDLAEELAREALRSHEALVGHDHPSVAVCEVNLSWILRLRGRTADAEKLAREALALQERLLGSDHVATSASQLNLAWVLHGRGNESEAESLARAAAELRERRLPPDHPEIAEARATQAFFLGMQGRDAEAEPIARAALDQRRRVLGDFHVAVANSSYLLAEILARSGRKEEAEELFRDAIEMAGELCGEGADETTRAMDGLGRLLLAQQRFDEAQPVFEKVLELRRARYGEDHPDVITSLNNLGAWCYFTDDLDGAVARFEQAAERGRRILGASDPETAIALSNVVSVLLKRGEVAKAQPLADESFEVLRSTRGLAHWQTVKVLQQRIEIYRHLNQAKRVAECEALLQEARSQAR